MNENLYDEVIITLMKDGKPNGQIKMERGAIASLRETHGQSTGDIMELMFQTLIDEAKNKTTESK